MHLLFDLDGTLADSRPGIIACIQHSLKENGLTVPAADELLWCIGPPLLETFKKLVSPDAAHLFEPAIGKYRDRYSAIGIFECEVYPGVESILTEFHALGHTLHVATSKAEIYAKRIIEHFGLGKYFASVNGSGLDGTRANKSELIEYILQQQNIAPMDAVMIGDREHDMIGAKANGIPAIGALWGYGTGGELMESGATLCARVPQLLPELIESLQ
ncbi:MAG: HAD hydrolase-like protein [Verrucomicrobiota bacterium]